MYSTNNEGKSVATERFIRTLKNKTYKYMTSISKNLYIGKLNNIVNNTIIHIIAQSKWNLFMLRMIHILILIKK